MKMPLKLFFRGAIVFATIVAVFVASAGATPEPAEIINLWPGQPPGEPMDVGPEHDTTGPDGHLVAGRRVMRIGNVSTPQLHVFLPKPQKNTGTTVVVCPGGGFSILAWDLEGTEVAEWLNSIGVAAAVLKYRVPTRDRDPRWLAPAQDAQRAMSFVRARARGWRLDPKRVGMLGFSAGGSTTMRVAFLKRGRLYEGVDAADQEDFRPDFCLLVYSGGITNEQKSAVLPELMPTPDSPPTFFVHAADDRVPIEGPVLLFQALREAGVPTELHVYEKGGHGYGLRPVEGVPVTRWADRCEAWMRARGLLSRRS